MTPQMVKVECLNCHDQNAEKFGNLITCKKCGETYKKDEKSDGWIPAGPIDLNSGTGDDHAEGQVRKKSTYEELLCDYLGE